MIPIVGLTYALSVLLETVFGEGVDEAIWPLYIVGFVAWLVVMFVALRAVVRWFPDRGDGE